MTREELEKLAEKDARSGTSLGEWYKPDEFEKVLDSAIKYAFIRGFKAGRDAAATAAEEFRIGEMNTTDIYMLSRMP